jgi:hypothetical protein
MNRFIPFIFFLLFSSLPAFVIEFTQNPDHRYPSLGLSYSHYSFDPKETVTFPSGVSSSETLHLLNDSFFLDGRLPISENANIMEQLPGKT